MKKIIVSIGIIGIFLLASMITVSAIESGNDAETNNDFSDTSTTAKENFYFCKVDSSGYGYCAINVPGIVVIYYMDENATTTIKSLFGLRSFTIEGSHTLILTPSYFRFGNIDAPNQAYGDCLLNCRGLTAQVAHKV